MHYYKNETLTYPFTAYYYGYTSDLSPDARIYVNLYSDATNQLVDADTLVDLKEVSQIGNDTLFVGTAYLNKLHNDLPAGGYKLKISLQNGLNIIDLIYAPITIDAHQSPFAVSFAGRERMLPEELNYHLRDVIDPGVKSGFDITPGTNSYSFDIHPGVLFTREGVKIEHGRISRNAIHIDPAGSHSRVDVVCIYYNKEHKDEQDSPHPPVFTVLKGIEDGLNIPPSIPPHHERIAYAKAPVNTQTPLHIEWAKFRMVESRRPFFSVPSFNIGDGVRSRFEFPVEYIPGTTTADVDGVLQYPGLGEDYIEVRDTAGRGVISFVGEVPQPGQRVYLNGQALCGPFFEHDYSIYPPPPAPVSPVLLPYTRDGLTAEFRAGNLTDKYWPDSVGVEGGFYQDDPTLVPMRGWDSGNGDYVMFDSNRYFVMDNRLGTDTFTIVIKGDFRDVPQNLNWMRILSKKAGAGYSLNLMAINKPTDPELHLMSMDGHITLLPGYLWRDGPSKIAITREAPSSLKLDCNGVSAIAATSGIGYTSEDKWYLGAEDGVGAGSRLEGKLTLLLFYNRVLSQAEIDAI